ncbi:3-hydroxyanthranilate 3,4-dioxygenase [Lewinellaceae bacterium SD302]|nr:3-hydroxyanthranilate 3,4-dioxygenase [Lewinellaceae bacterium SD302]
MPKLPPPINFKQWIDDNRHLLKPPVGNKAIYNDDYIVMVVGGPNSRKDYHLNQTPEFFYQVEGDITLKVIEDGEPRDVNIREGEVFYLPADIPHSPQRGANTVGLVIEQRRPEGTDDGLAWFCENCHNKLYEEPFTLKNIEKDMPVIFDRYYSNEELRTCDACGTTMQPPT